MPSFGLVVSIRVYPLRQRMAIVKCPEEANSFNEKFTASCLRRRDADIRCIRKRDMGAVKKVP